MAKALFKDPETGSNKYSVPLAPPFALTHFGLMMRRGTLPPDDFNYPPPTRENVGLCDLARRWQSAKTEIVFQHDTTMVRDPGFLHRVRGAMGHALAPGASADALAGKHCSFDPPSAYGLFHGVYRVHGDYRMPVPYYLSCDALSEDLIVVRLRLFGAATRWMPAFAEALGAAVQERGIFQPGKGIIRSEVLARVTEHDAPPPFAFEAARVLKFLSPVILRRGNKVLFDHAILWRALLQRLKGIALLHGVLLDVSPEDEQRGLELLQEAPVSALERVRWALGARAGGKTARTGYLAEILIPPGEEALHQAIGLGLLTGVGSRASEGCGRFRAFELR